MSNSADDPSQRAKNEAEVLKLIYGENVIYCKMYDAWKRFNHLQVCIRVVSSISNGLSVDIDFDCPADYPHSAPKIRLLQPIGITQETISELYTLLQKKISKSSGSELIYDLCVDAQNFLQTKDVPGKSMHERMLHRQESSSSPQTRSESTKRGTNRYSFTEYEDADKAAGEIKKEEELNCRRQQLLQQIGTLGNNTKVELISKPGQLIDIAKIMNFEVQRKPLNTSTYEWFGFDQSRVVLVSEFRFDSTVNRRNKEELVNFERTIKKFVDTIKVRSFSTDNFLTQYAFFHTRREKRTKFSLDFLIGQYVDLDSKCMGVQKVLNELKSKKKSILPKFANHLLCGLKTLHEQRYLHGNLNLDCVWINSDNNFLLSDHSLMPEILNLYDQFGQINAENTKQRQTSISSLRIKDYQSVGNLLKQLSTDSNTSSSNNEIFNDFIAQCLKTDVDAHRLLNHPYLYQGFTSMSGSDDESLLSSADLTENSGRLVNEYNILGFLGSGGFGSVFLTRNKLDGNDYAVKRISLYGMSQKQVERIKNEVAVFSKLTHEHITRYYSSWVETIVLREDSVESTTASNTRNTDLSLENELPDRIRNLNKNEEDISVETSESIEESSESSSTTGVGFFRGGPKHNKVPAVLPNILSQGGNDLSIMFVGSDNEDEEESEEASSSNMDSSVRSKNASFLCLQMEFCSNNTLRSLIDYSQLYTNPAMIWRLFKETLLGLEFMHSYNLIHRDVKPGNIFLDANWNVKIGDFGLATRLIGAPTTNTTDLNASKEPTKDLYSMTKDIGTAFYIPPEAKRTTSFGKNYDEKFDIYSIGIVLFEMIMKPADSRSERIVILERLRNEIMMPAEYLNYLPENQRNNADSIIRWCLSDSPEQRPSATELLQSNRLPQIISEDDRFHKTISQLAQDPKHRLRRQLFNELFSPSLPPPIGLLYDKHFCNELLKRRRIFSLNCTVIEFLSKQLRLNGYSQLGVESLLPSIENYSIEMDNYFGSLSRPYKVIDENGMILTMPTNLRQILVRYLAHNGISRLHSFAIDKTYAQTTSTSAYSSHPETRIEFCLDILRPKSSNSDLVAIEILQMVIKISYKLRPLSTNKWQILLNHAFLVKAISMHYSINDQQRIASFFNLLYDFSSRLKKVEYNSLAFEISRNFNMSEKQAHELIQLIETPNRSIHKLREHLRPIINTKSNDVKTLIERCITQMDFIFQTLCHNLDTSLELTFLPSFVYQPLIFSDGLMFSLRVEINEKGKKFWCPILGGGCYDSFLRKSCQINENASNFNTSAYGFNLSVENISHLLKSSNLNVAEKFGLLNSALISCTSQAYTNTGQSLASQLRDLPMSVELWNEEALSDSLFEYGRDKFINYIIVLFGADELIVYLNTFDKSIGNEGFKLQHNRISLTETFKFVAGSMKKEHNESDVQKPVDVERQEQTVNVSTTATLSNVNLAFCISRGFKLTHHGKEKYKSQVYAILTPLVKRFNKSIKIDAIITELPTEIIKQISQVERSPGKEAFVDFEAIANSQSAKYKKDVMLLYEELETFFQQPSISNHVVFLFCPRYSETFYRILM